MILTDREIRAFLSSGQIIIRPEPQAPRYSSTSVDLTLGQDVQEWRFPDGDAGHRTLITPGRPGYKYDDLRRKYSCTQSISDGYVLRLQHFILAWTAEEIELPHHSRIAARVEGKSSLARLGIGVHVTAPTIHAGFAGPLQLEMCNHGPGHVELVPGMPICQIIFEMTFGTPEKGYSGQFKYQKPG